MSTDLVVSDVEVLKPGQVTLEELAAAVNGQHAQVMEHASMVIEAAIRAGDLLLAAKEIVPQGEFVRWVEQNIWCRYQTASNYMRIAKFKDLLPDEIRHGNRIMFENGREMPTATLRNALRYLRAIDANSKYDPRIEREKRDEMRRLLDAGVPNREVSRLVGVSSQVVYLASLGEKERRAVVKRWNQNGADRKKALLREKRREEIKASSTDLAEAYSLIRRALQKTQTARDTMSGINGHSRRSLDGALSSLHRAEDCIGNAVRKGDL